MILWTSCFQICSIPTTPGTEKSKGSGRTDVHFISFLHTFHLLFAKRHLAPPLPGRAAQRQHAQHTAPCDRRSPPCQWDRLVPNSLFSSCWAVSDAHRAGNCPSKKEMGRFQCLDASPLSLICLAKCLGKAGKAGRSRQGRRWDVNLVLLPWAQLSSIGRIQRKKNTI